MQRESVWAARERSNLIRISTSYNGIFFDRSLMGIVNDGV
jgi:hypothetical protein